MKKWEIVAQAEQTILVKKRRVVKLALLAKVAQALSLILWITSVTRLPMFLTTVSAIKHTLMLIKSIYSLAANNRILVLNLPMISFAAMITDM